MEPMSLEEKIQRTLDYQEIENLMNRYEVKLTGGCYEEVENMFAKKTPGIRVEMMWGVYEGTEGIKRLFSRFHREMQGDTGALKPGVMFSLPNSNPIIEIAGDEKTAKGVWVCMGHNTVASEGGKTQAYWSYARRATDFVKEDGEWKIWHYHVYGGFSTSYEKSWTEGFDHREMPLTEATKPDKPPTTYWMYKPDVPFRYEPVPPEPYETFDDKDAY